MSAPSQPGAPEAATFEQFALGFGQRRVLLVAGLLGGFCIAGAGLAWALGAAAYGLSPESGLSMIAVGLVVTALGWLATAGLRFTRKFPKPRPGSAGVEAKMRESIIAGWIAVGLVAAGCLALFLFSPRGREPDAASLLPSFIAFPAVLQAGLLHIRRTMRRRDQLFASWLARQPS